jgi:hypothetical protein
MDVIDSIISIGYPKQDLQSFQAPHLLIQDARKDACRLAFIPSRKSAGASGRTGGAAVRF